MEVPDDLQDELCETGAVQSHISHNISLKSKYIYVLDFRIQLPTSQMCLVCVDPTREWTECLNNMSSRPRVVFFYYAVVAGLVEVCTVDVTPLLGCPLVGFITKSVYNYGNIYR